MSRRTRSASSNDHALRQWAQNPTATIVNKPVARFRVRGFGVREVDDPALIDVLIKGGQASNPHLANALVQSGLLTRPEQVPQDVFFRAPLSLRTPRLLPGETPASRPAGRLVLNPELFWQTNRIPPPIVRQPRAELAHLSAPPILWVTDPATRIVFPYWPDQTIEACVRQLQDGREPHLLPRKSLLTLSRARIVFPEAYLTRFKKVCEQASRDLADNGYVVLRELFGPLQIAFLRSYFRAIEREGYLTRGDHQVKRRHVMYREPLCSQLHAQLVPLISQVTGAQLLASYSYFGVYLPGAVLERHKDRPQCQWNLSVVWDTRPERPRTEAWPIYLDVNGQPHEVKLGMGDGLLYQGTKHFHWRERQAPGNRTTTTFFHFVDAQFGGDLD